MREGTKRGYESRIKTLEGLLDKAEDRSSRWHTKFKEAERRYDRLLSTTRRGEDQRAWAVEQAIVAKQDDTVLAATQIINFVYPEIES